MVTASTTSRLCISEEKKEGRRRRSGKGETRTRVEARPPPEGNEKSKERTKGLTGSRSVKIPNNVGHTGLVSEGSGEVDGLLRVVLGEGLHLNVPKRERKEGTKARSAKLRSSMQRGKEGEGVLRRTFPRPLTHRFLGRKPRDPCRGASYWRRWQAREGEEEERERARSAILSSGRFHRAILMMMVG